MINVTFSKKAIEGFCSKDSMRPAMEGVYYDSDYKSFVATNSHILVVINNIEDIDNEFSDGVAFPLDAFPKSGCRNELKRIDRKTFEVSEFDKKDKFIQKRILFFIDNQFPNYKAVIPNVDTKTEFTSHLFLEPESFIPFSNLKKELDKYSDALRFDIFSKDTAILVRSSNDSFEGVIKPRKSFKNF